MTKVLSDRVIIYYGYNDIIITTRIRRKTVLSFMPTPGFYRFDIYCLVYIHCSDPRFDESLYYCSH